MSTVPRMPPPSREGRHPRLVPDLTRAELLVTNRRSGPYFEVAAERHPEPCFSSAPAVEVRPVANVVRLLVLGRSEEAAVDLDPDLAYTIGSALMAAARIAERSPAARG